MCVWLINPFDNLPQEGNRAQRYWLMARAFVRAGHEVVYWTSDFSHATKAKRVFRVEGSKLNVESSEGIRLVLIPTKPYLKNICLARVASHRALAADFRRMALEVGNAGRDAPPTEKPQVVIASMPPLGLCEAARQVAAKFRALFIADVQDAWPETFERILPRFVWSLIGMRRTARRIYCESDGVSAVAKRYLDLAKEYGCRAPAHLAGHAIETVLDPIHREREASSPLRLVYAGNMSLSYDLETVIKAVADRSDVTLDIAGNGPDRARLEQLATADNIRFHGYLGEVDLHDLLRRSDVGIVPMFPESCVGVPGKLADYAAAGLRVIESLGGETAEIVDRYRVGVHYEAGNAESLSAAIEELKGSASAGDASSFRTCFDARSVMDGYVDWVEKLERHEGRVLHVVPGLNEVGNGIAVAAKLIADGQRKAGHEVDLVDVDEFIVHHSSFIVSRSEVWVHSMWLPAVMKACRMVLKAGLPLVRMTHANLDPLRLGSKGWKKVPVWRLFERRLMNQSARVVATCAAEADWNRRAGVTAPIEVHDLRQYFSFPKSQNLGRVNWENPDGPRHVLYLGRSHPLKGVEFLREAVKGMSVELHEVGDKSGEALEMEWRWADVLCLPTLSENFGLVVAEALERGKPVITTDGAPVWEGQPGVQFVKGYRAGTPKERVALLREAIARSVTEKTTD